MLENEYLGNFSSLIAEQVSGSCPTTTATSSSSFTTVPAPAPAPGNKYSCRYTNRGNPFVNRPNVQNGLGQSVTFNRGQFSNSSPGDGDGGLHRPPFITVVSRGKFLPSKFDLLVERSLFTYSSRPRAVGVGYVSKHQCSPYGGTRTIDQNSPPRGLHDYSNIMWDPHIRRGNTGVSRVLGRDVTDTGPKSGTGTGPGTGTGTGTGTGSSERTEVKVRKKRFTNSNYANISSRNNRQFPPKKYTAPLPIEGRFRRAGVEKEKDPPYLDYLRGGLGFGEADANIQTDRHDVPVLKMGVDASTQILEGELLDFDNEIEPILTTLVAKILEQSLMETMEEEEIAALNEQKNRFRAKKQEEEEQLKILQEQHKNIRTERVRLKMDLEGPPTTRGLTQAQEEIETSFEERSSADGPMFTTSCLLKLLPSVLNSLKQEGFLIDNIGDDVLSTFVSNIDTKSIIDNFNNSANNSNSTSDMDNNDTCETDGSPYN